MPRVAASSKTGRKVKVNLYPVLRTLQALGEKAQRMDEEGDPFVLHVFIAPKNMPVDYRKAAEQAI